MDLSAIKGMMCEIPLFDQLSPDQSDVVARSMEHMRVAKGSVLVREGSPGHALYYIVGGKVEIRKESMDGRQAVLTQFTKGAIVGELALLEEQSRRSASATAVEDCEILALSRQNFDAMIKTHPEIGIVILRGIGCILANRLRSTTGRFADVFS